jgi:two-component system cell cycle sensor histidine kinase/response regulator CckA
VRDITEQRRVERELRENEARLGLALESAGLGFWDADLETGEVVLSERWASMLGYTAQELRGDRDPWRDRIHPDDLAAALRALERHTNGETEVYESEHRLRTRSGGWIWVNDWGRVVERAPDGKARRIIGAQRDISDRKQTEAALRESEARYRSFFEQDLTGDFITTVGGAIVECNPTFARTFGFASAERAKGTDITLLYPDPSQRRVFLDRLRRERQLTYFEQTLRRLDGTPVHVVENAVGSFDERGELVSIKGYLFDITAQKQAEEQLRGAQKMEAVGRLAGGVAHDFNNLLQAMVGVTQLLQMQRPDDREVQAAVGEMAQLVKRATALTRQLLLFAHRGATRLEKLDLNEVVREAAAMLRRLVHANVHFTLEQPEATLHAPGDAGQLEQVLMNLVVNAVDAMPEGGRLTIRTGRARGRVWFEVADTGTGVPVEVRDKIFDPFFTTKAKGKGTGLGLSVVHGIVAAHGGHIALTTEVGQGTTVRIELPASGSGVYPAVPEAAADTAAQGTGERLLVVEDDATVRAQLQATLQAFGYEVHAAATGEDAGALPGEPGFDLLLTDVMLPGASGVAVARELRDRWPGLKVVMMSGYAEDEVLREEILAGQVRFLQKPVDATTLAREVRGALDEG